MQQPLSPPDLMQTLLEVRSPVQIPLLLLNMRSLKNAPKGDGRAVLLLPGYLTDKYAMRPLKKYLSWLGYQVFDWAQGRNKGQVEHYVAMESEHLRGLAHKHQISNFTLVGWSLGGVIAREIARLNPALISEVLTMGSPITGGPKYTAPGRRFAKRQSIDLDALEADILERNRKGLSQKVTSIYSKSDGIVAWQASVDHYNPHAVNIEVSCTHMAMGISPEVWLHIAHVLQD